MAKAVAKEAAKVRPGRVPTQPDAGPDAQDVLRGPAFTRRNYVLFGAALLTIAAGFLTLAGGSITLAPILLVIGYLVLVPLAILKR